MFGVQLDDLEAAFQVPEKKSCFDAGLSDTPKRPIIELGSLTSLPKARKSRFKLPKMKTLTIPAEGCIHEVVIPPGTNFRPLGPMSDTPAKTYPFKLDPFQRQSILAIENKQSVLVSAHTSAGKTVVAEYAIALGLAAKQRVIYTTPIKALSNQKFREFSREFKDVGLMTGDITINPESTLLIMTTEILRSMLYRGSEVTRELGWVIFDEIHYMREKERGVVWEESIILLPDSVNQVFLSATIPNARQFAEWVVHLHRKPCHVIFTNYRPTPLQHYVYPCGGDGIFLVVNQERQFLEANFNAALDVVRKSADNAKADTAVRGRKGGSTRSVPYCYKLVKLVMDQNLDPLIVFSFSKRDCEFYALQLAKQDFNDEQQRAAVDLIFNNAMDSLSKEDRNLPQVLCMLPMLRRGVGIHHGGLLPILKELVEILFAEGYIKVLFATETFAMGLNMPARTVLFTSTRKFDGRDFRHVSSGEYIQMSGRAGRRGKDDRGTVILMLDNTVTPDAAKQLLLGNPDPLNSAFTLSYNMVLNLLLVEDVNPQIMLQKSFYQFQNYSSIPELEQKITRLTDELEKLGFPKDVDIEHLSAVVQLQRSIEDLEREKWSLTMKFKHVAPFLQPGRIVRVESIGGIDFGWAVVLNLRRSKQRGGQNNKGAGLEDVPMVDCLLKVSSAGAPTSIGGGDAPWPLSFFQPANEDMLPDPEDNMPEPSASKTPRKTALAAELSQGGETSALVTVASVPLSCLRDLSSVCLNFRSVDGANVKEPASLPEKFTRLLPALRLQFWEGISRARNKLDGNLPVLHPVDDLGVRDSQLIKCLENIQLLDARLKLNPLSQHPKLEYLVHTYGKRAEKFSELTSASKELSKKESLLQLDELISRKRVLRRLGFCSEDDVIHLKGRIACEISTGDELMLTELLLDGFFSDMTPEQLAGVLSCFVAEKSTSKEGGVRLQPDMEAALQTIKAKARFLAQVALESRVGASGTGLSKGDQVTLQGQDDIEAYLSRFNGDMMDVVRAWAQGVSFAALCQMTTVYEGSVIRCMRRLEELLRQMHSAVKVAGNTDLENKFLKAMLLIKRDIVFAASLYL
uniref:Superkiller viralicidic activity 2-like 2 n=1 Tax=Schistocephalus solidus TaxID=70667 RepID=A0A0X3PBY2_SCHSO